MLRHFKNYLSSSWTGKIVKGGKHLARALAMLAIEAVFALMFGGKAAFKAVKSGAKSIAKNGVKASLKSGAKLAKTTAKNGLKSGVQGAKRFKRIVGAGTQRAGKNLAKGGKFMVSGVRKGAMKGAKSLKSVVKNLSKKLKFDKYRFTLKGRKFKLEGHLNPWVLFANGEIRQVDRNEIENIRSTRVRGDVQVINSDGTRTSAKLITKSNRLPSSAYKRIYELANNQTSRGQVIHHMVEQQTRNMTNLIDDAFLNNANRLKAFSQGVINNTVHLSGKGIRGLWDDFYQVAEQLRNVGMLNDRQFVSSLDNFAGYTDNFINHTLNNLTPATSQVDIINIMNTWKSSNPVQSAIMDAINTARN